MSQIQAYEFDCTVYPTDGIDAYPATAEIYVATTAAFLVYSDGTIRQLTTGENAAVHELTQDHNPLKEDTVQLYHYDNAFYSVSYDVSEVTIGDHYVVDTETVITPVSKTNQVKDPGPIETIAGNDFSPDHEDIYIIQRDNPFGRFRYPTTQVNRFVRSDRVAKLDPVV